VLLALIALFGYMAVADPTTAANVKKTGNAQLAVPYLFQHMFPSWFTGIAFAGIIIGALVPAAIMSIAAANLFTRNVFTEFVKQDASPALQTRMSQWASLVVKLGALLFAVELPRTFSINLQLLGGVWILQVAPMMIGGLFTRWFHRWALLTGWLAGMAYGTIAAYNVKNATTSHWAASSDIVFGHTIYIGLTAVIINLVIAVVLTLILKAVKVPEGTDETLPHQYTADPEDAPARAPAGVGAPLEG
jgi:SSS family solute:Na+ symporter